MGFVQNNVGMLLGVSEFTQLACVDLHLRGNDSGKISKNLKLPTCTSIYVHMVSDLEIRRYGFCLEYGKLIKAQEIFQNYYWFGMYGWSPNSNLPKLMKTTDFWDLS